MMDTSYCVKKTYGEDGFGLYIRLNFLIKSQEI